MMKKSFSAVLMILAFFIGLSLLLYPTVSDYWNSLHQTQAIAEYDDQVGELDSTRCKQLWADARRYNEALTKKADRYEMSEEEQKEYQSQLNISGNGIIGYIEIPLIGCYLPVYHGTKESVFQIAIGHVEGTSLPTGGKGTHCVLSGHRGLPRARLFTDLDKLAVGDDFILHILNETMTYETDQILIVEPDEMNALEIDPNRDYCTLVTCTPYGINSHRLLVRGHRVENQDETRTVRVTADAIQIEPMIVASLMGAPMLFILLIVLLIPRKKR